MPAPTCCPRSTPPRSRPRAACPCCSLPSPRRVPRPGWCRGSTRSSSRAARTSTRTATARSRTPGWRPDRDAWELALLDAAEEAGLPVLGICRGMQLMAVHAGGSLDQHTPDLVGHETHSPGGDTYGSIDVATESGSRLAALVGASVEVSCHHHQSVATHPGFTAVARAADGTLEAMESAGEHWRVAVQWHPETRVEIGLMAGLVAAAREHAAAGGR